MNNSKNDTTKPSMSTAFKGVQDYNARADD
jgi:hypothetical protein